MGVKQALKSLDAFPRTEDHLLQKTQSGAYVSIVGLVIMATLFIHELKYYLSTYTVHQMAVDLNRGETLPIHINMSFPSLPCDVLSVDAIDLSGKHEVDLDTNIWKLRLNRDGVIVGSEYLSDLVEKGHGVHKHEDHTGNRAHKDDHEHDHKENHDDSEKKIHLEGFDKDAENLIERVKHAIANEEGCLVYGSLDVQRVAGNFHISVHGLNIFVAQMIFGGATHVNVSHVINDLSFGPKYPGIHNPLDGTVRILHDTSGTFKYYIKVNYMITGWSPILSFLNASYAVVAHVLLSLSVDPPWLVGESLSPALPLAIVPTEYRYLSKKVLPTNQFSVTEYFSPINEYDRTWPAVYFLYDLSPITVTIKEERRSFLHFITRLCAVLGGTFALTGMLDKWMYRLLEVFTKSKSQSLLL